MAASIWRASLTMRLPCDCLRFLMKLGIASAASNPMMATTIMISTKVNACCSQSDRLRIGLTSLHQHPFSPYRPIFLAAEAGGGALLPLAYSTKSACALALGQALVGAPVDTDAGQRSLRSEIGRA